MKDINIAFFLMLFAIPAGIFSLTQDIHYTILSAGVWAFIGAIVEAFENTRY